MLSKTIYISGYWHLENNIKRKKSDYDHNLKQTIAQISGATLIFYGNDESVLNNVADLCNQHNVRLVTRQQTIADLPSWMISAELIKSCERMQLDKLPFPPPNTPEKGLVHYWRDYKNSPTTYRDMLAIWTSKPSLVMDALDSSDFGDFAYYCWIDASISRFNNRRSNWRFWKTRFVGDAIHHYASPMKYFSYSLPINASFLGGNPTAWRLFHSAYQENLASASQTSYAHDEETILFHVIQSNPQLFTCIGKPDISKFQSFLEKIR
jgi:hypothetical protein